MLEQVSEMVEPEIPFELKGAIDEIVSNFNHNKMVCWYPIKEYLWRNIIREESRGNIHPGEKVLDLGSGPGDSLLTWSYRGYPVTGIELDERLYDNSTKLIKNYPELIKAPIKVFNGSYYPEEYLEDRKNKSHVKKIEMEFAEYLYRMQHSNLKHYNKRFKPICDVDIYKKYSIDMKEFDIWYAYLWDYQTPSVMDMFIKYARDDAKLLLISAMNKDIAQQMNLSSQPLSHLFRKCSDVNYKFFDW